MMIIFVLICTIHSTMGAPQALQEKVQCSGLAEYGYYCVPFYQCDQDSKIIIDGTGLVDVRATEVDCKEAPSPTTATTSLCGKLIERCCLHPKLDPCSPDKKKKSSCGKRNIGGIVEVRNYPELSVGETEFGEWPHVCAVLENKSVGGTDVQVYMCGASLLDTGVVLTAGHCVKDIDPNTLVVRCGEWDTGSDDPLEYQEKQVDTIEIHPCFNNDNHHNNFALLFLQSNMSLASHIRPICLPPPDHVWPGGQPCVSNGWGKDKFGREGKYSNILKEVVVPLVKSPECQTLLRENTRLGPFYELDSSLMCAGGQEGVDTCKGDGGSPLVCEQPDGSWAQAGIVSFGIGCGGDDIPAVYADVASAACWIDNRVSCYYGGQGTKSFFGYTKSSCPSRGCTHDTSACFK